MAIKKIINLYRYIDSMNRLSPISSMYPPVVSIETSAICNLACNKCPAGRERKVPSGCSFMDIELYKKIITEIKNYSISVDLSYIGEPLLNPRFFEYVRIAKENKLAVSFFSNGILLDSKIIDNIVKYDVNQINFSIDCLPSQYEFYSKMKNVPLHDSKQQLETIIEHIELLSTKIKNLKKNTVLTAIRMDAPESTPEIEYQKFWETRGVISLSGRLIDWAQGINRINVTQKHTCLSLCTFPYGFIIQSDGVVPMCCVDFNASFKLGDVKGQTIKEIYNGEIIRNIRKKMGENNILDLPCARCRHEDFLIRKQNLFLGCLRHFIALKMGRWYLKMRQFKHMLRNFLKYEG